MSTSRGEIRLRTLLEIVLLIVVAYAAFQVAPAVVLRVQFFNEMELAANSPIDMEAWQIRQKLRDTAEGMGLTLLQDNLHVIRDQTLKRTMITAQYQIHINLLPRVTYVWHVEDQVEGYLF